jgi:hypothetical protein
MLLALILFILSLLSASNILLACTPHHQETIWTLVDVEKESVAQIIRVAFLGELIPSVLGVFHFSVQRVNVIWEDEVLALDPKCLRHLNYRHQQTTLNNEDNRHSNRFPLRLISRRFVQSRCSAECRRLTTNCWFVRVSFDS